MSANGQQTKGRKAYLEKLRDPRWQRKRLEIMQRDEWTCQHCGDTTQTLNVHHLCYRPRKDPWEYEDEALLTLCDTCHTNETRNLKEARREIVRLMLESPWEHASLDMLSGFLCTVQWFHLRHGLDRETIIVKATEALEHHSDGIDEVDAFDAARNTQQRALWHAAL